MSLTFYCNSFKNSLPTYSQYIQRNLMCGSSSLDEVTRQQLTDKGFLFDDTKDNISHLNKYLGDLTGLYWVWKNTDDEFVGTNQYRRFWVEDDISQRTLTDNTLYISAYITHPVSLTNQYIQCHNAAGLYLLENAIKMRGIDMSMETLNELNLINSISSCNMFFGHRKIFNKVCETVFPIVFELFEGSKYTLDFIQPAQQTRLIAFLTERILTLLYHKKDYYFGNINIETIRWQYK